MSFILSIIAFLSAIIVHEVAHAWMADRLGDPTARLRGRLTLNPMAHLDPYGTVLVPLLLIFLRSPIIFGWAKPVVFDPFNLKNPKKDSAIISLAGPGANFILAIALSLILKIIYSPFFPYLTLVNLIIITMQINVILGLFNLIPIHPLDGGKIFVGLLPDDQAREADLFLRRYGFLILLFLIFPTINGRPPLFLVLTPVINFIMNLLMPGVPIV